MRNAIAAPSLVLMCAAATLARAAAGDPGPSKSPAGEVWPTRGWTTSTPEAQGLDSGPLADALDFVREHHVPIHSLLIERNGAIVLDAYFFPFSDHQVHDLASATKSVTSTLVGMLIGAGKLSGADQPVLPLFQDEAPRSPDPRRAAIRIGDLLDMSSGIECDYGHGERTLEAMMRSPHWARFMLNLPMVADPGSTFAYSSGGMHLLSAVVTKVTGRSALDVARSGLFAPLGIAVSEWPSDADGVSHGWGDLRLQPRDMARLGYLWLHHGAWGGRQLVPAGYLDSAAKVHSRAPWGDRYGYGFWVYPDRTPPIYEANGRGGQRISVIPSKNMVVVFTGGGFEPGDEGAFILKALKNDAPLPANPEGDARLAAAVAAAAAPGTARAPAPLPPLAARISGRLYRLDDNPFDLRSVAFSLQDAGGASVRFVFRDGRVEEDAIGLGGVPRLTPGGAGRPVAVEGRWERDALDLEYDRVSDINAYTLRFASSGRDVAIRATMRAQTGELDVSFLAHGPN